MPVGCLEPTSCREPLSATRRLVLASTMRQRQFSATFRSLACQSRTRVPTRSRRSTLPATQVVRKRTLLALGATHVGGSPPTSGPGRSSKPDATFHPVRWAAQAAKRISRDPPRLPRDRHLPLTVAGIWLLKVSSRLIGDVRCWTRKFGGITNESLSPFVSDRLVYFLNQPCGNGGCPQIPNPSKNLSHMPNRGKK